MLAAQVRVRLREIRIMPNDFFLNLVRFIDVFILEIQNWVEQMLAQQRTDSIFPAPPSEDGALPSRALAFQIQFARPSPEYTIFQLEPRCEIGALIAFRHANGRSGGDFKISRLLQVMAVGDEIRTLLPVSRHRREQRG